MKNLLIKGSLLLSLCFFSVATLHKEVPSLAKRDNKEFNCLVEVMVFESFTESRAGIEAVASVVVNRALKEKISYCSVIFAPKQFSYRNRLKNKELMDTAKFKDHPKFKTIQNIAYSIVINNFKTTLPSNVLHYASHRIQPNWTRNLINHKRIGEHVFYATPSRKAM